MGLSDADRRLVRLSVAMCTGNWEALREVRRGAPPGEPDRRWREAMLQAHLFAGFPRVVEACGVLAEEGGLGAPDEDETRPQGDRFEAGRALFERIYAGRAADVRAALQGFHPTLERWIEGHAYGRVLARDGLSADRRELLAVACLAALANQEPQLAAHARGALRVGASVRELTETLDTVAELVDAAAVERARRLLGSFRDEAGSHAHPPR